MLRIKKKFPTLETRRKLCPFFLRDSGASETRARVKITPREKGEQAAGGEKNEGLLTKPKLLNLCVAITTQNSDWLIHGNLSTFLKTRHFSRETAEKKKIVSGVSFTCNKLNIPCNLPMTRAMTAQ